MKRDGFILNSDSRRTILDQTVDLEILNLFRFPEHGMHLALLLVFSLSYRLRSLPAFILFFSPPCSFMFPY